MYDLTLGANDGKFLSIFLVIFGPKVKPLDVGRRLIAKECKALACLLRIKNPARVITDLRASLYTNEVRRTLRLRLTPKVL